MKKMAVYNTPPQFSDLFLFLSAPFYLRKRANKKFMKVRKSGGQSSLVVPIGCSIMLGLTKSTFYLARF